MATRKRAELFGDENWVEVEPGYWENYGLSDDIPSIAEDDGQYIVQFNGAESMADDMYTQTFDSLEDAVNYAEDMLASGRLASRKDFIAGYMAGIRHRKQALTITEYPEGWEEDPDAPFDASCMYDDGCMGVVYDDGAWDLFGPDGALEDQSVDVQDCFEAAMECDEYHRRLFG